MTLLPRWLLLILACTLIVSCKSSRFSFFANKTPRERYADALKKEDRQLWLAAAGLSLRKPLNIKLPYKERALYTGHMAQAVALRFDGSMGLLLTTALTRHDTSGLLFLELYSHDTATAAVHFLAAADTDGALRYELPAGGSYLLLVQPEFTRAVSYTLQVTTGPSLAYPVTSPAKNRIGSVWGDPRDAGARRHEGVDIFAPKGTPALAAAAGRITNVTNGGLGGKTVWLRPDGRSYSLYYAHLDSQWVSVGDAVRTGDTIGQVGNTGNARFTPAHLHFGIYGFGGAVNPAPFIRPASGDAPAISAAQSLLGKEVIARKNSILLLSPEARSASIRTVGASSPMRIEAASGAYYRVRVDSLKGWLPAAGLKEAD